MSQAAEQIRNVFDNFMAGENLLKRNGVAYQANIIDANHLPGGNKYEMSYNNAALAQITEQSKGMSVG